MTVRQGSILLRILALVAFILAALVAWPSGTFEHDAVLIPLGLALWVGASLVP